VWNNLGDPDYHLNHSGNGILVADTDGAMVNSPQHGKTANWIPKKRRRTCRDLAAGSNHVIIQSANPTIIILGRAMLMAMVLTSMVA